MAVGIFTDSEAAALATKSISKYAKDIYGSQILLPKIGRRKAGGRQHEFSVKLGGSSVNRSYSTGSTNAVIVSRKMGIASPKEVFSFGLVDGPADRSSQGAGDSRVDLYADAESDARGRGAQLLEHVLIMGRGYGEMGYVTAHTGTTGSVTFTLKNRRDARLIKVDDILEFADTPDVAIRTGYMTVTAVASKTGIISGTMGGSGDFSAGATVDGAAYSLKGNLSNGNGRVFPMGLKGMFTRLTADVSSGANFQGLGDRLSNDVYLAGHDFTLGNESVIDAIEDMSDEIETINGSDVDMFLVSTDKWRQAQRDLGEGQFTIVPSGGRGLPDAVFSNKAISFLTAKGRQVYLMGSPDMDNVDIYALDTDWIDLVSPNPVPFTPVGKDRGWFSLQPSGVDANKLSLVTTAELVCTAFAYQGHGTFNS
jgi:hypothetical protein